MNICKCITRVINLSTKYIKYITIYKKSLHFPKRLVLLHLCNVNLVANCMYFRKKHCPALFHVLDKQPQKDNRSFI